jgi:hypothetical protein
MEHRGRVEVGKYYFGRGRVRVKRLVGSMIRPGLAGMGRECQGEGCKIPRQTER